VISPEYQLEFLNKIQRLFAEGDFSASYRCALLITLADIAVETSSRDDASLQIPHIKLGEKFIDTMYWQQSVPYRNDKVLVQNNGVQATVITFIIQFRKKNPSATVISAKSESMITLLF
jgi:hypothetical protein